MLESVSSATLKRLIMAGLLIVSTVGAAPLRAHEVYRFVGTVVKWIPAKNTLDITASDTGTKIRHIVLREDATVVRDEEKVSRSELKAGLSVGVDAVGLDLDDIEGVQIKIVPRPSK